MVAAFHAQALKMDTPEAMEKTANAMHIAIARDRAPSSRSKDPGEFTTQDQAALRSYFNTTIAKLDAKTGVDKAELERQLHELGPEPEKESTGLFGVQTSRNG